MFSTGVFQVEEGNSPAGGCLVMPAVTVLNIDIPGRGRQGPSLGLCGWSCLLDPFREGDTLLPRVLDLDFVVVRPLAAQYHNLVIHDDHLRCSCRCASP